MMLRSASKKNLSLSMENVTTSKAIAPSRVQIVDDQNLPLVLETQHEPGSLQLGQTAKDRNEGNPLNISDMVDEECASGPIDRSTAVSDDVQHIGAVPKRLFSEMQIHIENSKSQSAGVSVPMATTMARPNSNASPDQGGCAESDGIAELERLEREVVRQRRILALRAELAEMEHQGRGSSVSTAGFSLPFASNQQRLGLQAGQTNSVRPVTGGGPMTNWAPAGNAPLPRLEAGSHRGERVRLDEIRPLISQFSGNTDYPVKLWLADFKNIMSSYNAMEMDYLRISRQLFIGAAASFIQNKVFTSWDVFEQAFIAEFYHPLKPSKVYYMLEQRKKLPNETPHEYLLEMEKIAHRGPCDTEELLARILIGLNDGTAAFAVIAAARTLAELRAALPRYGEIHEVEMARIKEERARRAQLPNNKVKPLNQPARGESFSKFANVDLCFKCSKPGHKSYECTNKAIRPKGSCFACGDTSHQIRDCPKKKVGMIAVGGEPTQPVPTWNDDVEASEAEIEEYQQVRVNWLQINGNPKLSVNANALIDSGSPVNFIRRSVVPTFIVRDNKPAPTQFTGIGNKTLFSYGKLDIEITFRHRKHVITCHIVPNNILPVDLLLGRAFMNTFKIKLQFSRRQRDLNIFKNIINYCHIEQQPINKPFVKPLKATKNYVDFNLNIVPSCIVQTIELNKFSKRDAIESVSRISKYCNVGFLNACRAAIEKIINHRKESKQCINLTGNQINVEENADINTLTNNCANELTSLEALIQSRREEVDLSKYSKSEIAYINEMGLDKLDQRLNPLLTNGKLNIGICHIESKRDEIGNVGLEFGRQNAMECKQLIDSKYLNAAEPRELPKMDIMRIRLSTDVPIYTAPRRLAYSDKLKVKDIVQQLIDKGIVRTSTSEYASPIVLVKKKSGDIRLCVDYRAINKITLRENWPLPLIDDCIEFLGGKDCFSIVDLKSGFHQLRMEEASIKFTSFVTPNGQYEYTRMPFGLKNGPSVFQRFVTNIFRDMIENGEIIIYIDDILVATGGAEQHLKIIDKLLCRLKQFNLEVNFEKSHFLQKKIDYLGYVADKRGIKPSEAHLKAIANYPQPKSLKELQACIGLFQYFRRFVAGFSRVAYPLTNLLKKDAKFEFNEECLAAFNTLKQLLVKAPVLTIYDPTKETELHTDASSQGYGIVLLQKQSDGKMHPVGYSSRKTSNLESKYHSFELETMAIIYGIRHFETMLKGIHFKKFTDCSALQMTLSKKNINPRIARWALELENFDYTVVHRKGVNMPHVDALSRHIAVITAQEVDFNIQATQARDEAIMKIRERLEKEEVESYRLENGLVYRYINEDQLSLLVPKEMEQNVIRLIHDKIGHLGINKCYDQIRLHYWFPAMKEKIQTFIENCLRCIMYSPQTRIERTLHPIPKKPVPFHTLHLDHYGPLPSIISKKRHILGISDAFTKYVKLFAVNVTGSKEVICSLTKYFEYYGRPSIIVTDRATCFTGREFEEFLKGKNIAHIKNATASPQANGQIERVNRVLTPMLGKMTEIKNQSNWSRILNQVEFALNNSISQTTKYAPSMLLFGILQRGPNIDHLTEHLEEIRANKQANLVKIREKADEAIQLSQKKSVERHSQRVAPAKEFQTGDFVVIRNIDTTIGTNKKLIPKFKGPYVVHKILRNDRYIVKDIENCQLKQIPYEGVIESARMRHWVKPNNQQN